MPRWVDPRGAAIVLTFLAWSVSYAEDVLVLGDSHFTGSISPGIFLDARLRAENPSLATYGVCGASSFSWIVGPRTSCGYYERTPAGTREVTYPNRAAAPRLEELLRTHSPKLLVIALGSNMAVRGYSTSAIRGEAARIAEAATNAGAECVWITPMNARSIQGRSRAETEAALAEVAQAIRVGVGPRCLVIDGAAPMRYPDQGGDGLHYSALPSAVARELSTVWSEAMFERLTD